MDKTSIWAGVSEVILSFIFTFFIFYNKIDLAILIGPVGIFFHGLINIRNGVKAK